MRPDSEFVWSMNCESCDEPKNSLRAATTGLMLTRVAGTMVSGSSVVRRSLMTRSMRVRPIRKLSWTSSPTVRRRRLPKCSYSSSSAAMSSRRVPIRFMAASA